MSHPAPPPDPGPDARRQGDEPWWKWRGRPWQFAGLAALAVLLAALWLTWALPINRALEPLPTPTLVLVSADGQAFGRRGSYKEEPVRPGELPDHVTGAFIAIEDRRFYEHFGLDPRGIARAMRANVREGGIAEGGSTITQQLAKNAFLSNRRTLRRKAQEAVIALYLEGRLSKDEILSRYLSSVYFGEGVFGLRAAARQYFDKAPEDLTIGEAAMLAGVVKAPSRLAPTEDLEGARERQQVVLDAMVETGVITEREARQARRVRIREGRPSLPVGSYFADWVSPQAKRAFERAYGEVTVQTTLDSRLQRRAEQIIRRRLNGARGLDVEQAALVAMRTDGSVVAMVGGRDYEESQFNRATDAQRQPGSAFKLFVYLAALREGASPEHRVMDAPVRLGDWRPQNHEERYLNRPITLREAFARSSNVAAVRVLKSVGVGDVIRTARDLGVDSRLPRDATVALGTGTVNLMEMTAAYAAIAAGETPVRPHGLESWVPPRDVDRIPADEREGMLELLRAVVTSGTGTAASLPGVRAYGKTGTTQDYRDALFIGFAGDLVVGVWVGNDDNEPMRRVAGGGLPAQIWREFMSYALSRGQVRGVQAPAREEAPPPEDEAPPEVGLDPSLLEGLELDEELEPAEPFGPPGTQPTQPPVEPRESQEEPLLEAPPPPLPVPPPPGGPQP